MIRALYRTDLERHYFAPSMGARAGRTGVTDRGRRVGLEDPEASTRRKKMRWIVWSTATLRGVAVTAVGLALALAACDGDSSGPSNPPIANEDDLQFVVIRADAPPLVTTDTSFWAVAGESRRLVIRQQPDEPGNEGDEFLRFEVKSGSLLRRPDGTAFQPGDSVLIRVTLDSTRVLAEFRPSGLEFDPDEPAELKIEYEDAEDEFLEIEGEIDLWRQERVGEPWVRLGSVRFEDLDEIEAKLTGFTRFALAIGR